MKSIYIVLFSVLIMGACSHQKTGQRASSGAPEDGVYTINVADAGAVGDGLTLNTAVLQKCIDEAHANEGGGRVYFGKGQWLSGLLRMRSNVEIYLDSEATLLGSTNPYDYDGGSDAVGRRGDEDVHLGLIVSDSAHHIRIVGQGTVDAQGLALALAIDSLHHIGERVDPNYNYRRMRPSSRPKLFFLNESDDIYVHGVTLKNSSNWGLSLHACTNVVVDSVTVVNRGYWNNDGIDMNDCKHVVVRNCDVNAADDGICLKSDNPESCCEDILIENCRIASSASAVKFGTASYGGFRNVTVRNIKVYDTFRSAIALETVDGGTLENILVENINAKNTGNPIFICLGARHPYEGKEEGRIGGICRNITIRNLKAEVPFGRPDESYDLRGPEVNYFHNPWPSSIAGLPGQYIENVKVENVNILYPGRATKGMAYVGLYRVSEVNEAANQYPEFSMYGELPSWAFYVRHVKDITFTNINVRLADEDFRPAFVFDDVQGFKMENVNVPENQIFLNNVTE
ncbi:MAG: right-handed parallel beta-helix repeat-containing protein [Bacteroidales bacterium]|nr:right-handed parallel beta-helix repeat-containing protein [Bacteroidales bacterium]